MLHGNILKIRDENATGQIFHELELKFDKVEVTVKDIIVERVYREVILYNQKADQVQNALVKPKDEEVRLNGKRIRHIDAEKQVEVALKAFESNGFFMLVDDFQAEALEQIVPIKENTVISFVKLTPLVGG
ncbi:MAG: hypothetical protein OEZ68_17340 [Gammaproteobacteria bacterium]|nr:hypothetical protein [Gammaproteobacteria bacterium]MDH5802568.1 hypothetical protein [Gammaproteobacteria bacterium]